MQEEQNIQQSRHKESYMDFFKKNSTFFVFCFIGLLVVTIPYGIMYEKSFAARHSSQLKDRNKHIVRPYSDDRLFKKIELSNKVTALLVHDPSALSSVAAASMAVGSAYETNLPGLAHFLEHMLFLGSKKYPKESTFEKYITENGGGTNAFTNDVCTTYFFSINAKAFEAALDMFANFFTDALLNEDAVDREVNAVNSEYENDLTSDGWRFQELLRRISDKSHPFHKFSIGNLKTLRDDPKNAGLSLHKELRDFYDKYYSGHLLNVVVIGPQQIDTLENFVRTSFANVPDKSKDYSKPDHLINPGKAFNDLNTGKIVFYKPISKSQTMSVIFPLDLSKFKNPLSHSSYFIASQLSRSYPGSLSSVLKENGFATSCYSYSNKWADDLTMIYIRISLTDEGFSEYEKVIEYVFAAVENLKNQIFNKPVYKEEALLSYMNFLYANKPSVSANLIEFALNLKKYPLNLLLVADEVLMDYREEEIEEIYNNMKIDKSVIILGSNTFKIPGESSRFKEVSPYHYEKIENFEKYFEIKDEEQVDIFENEDEIANFINSRYGARLGKLRKVIDENQDLTFHDFDIYSASEKVKDDVYRPLNATIVNATNVSKSANKSISESSAKVSKPVESKETKLEEVEEKKKSPVKNKKFRAKRSQRKKGKKLANAKKDLTILAPKARKPAKKHKKKSQEKKPITNSIYIEDDEKKANSKRTTDDEDKKSQDEDITHKILTSFDDIMKIPYVVEDISEDIKAIINDIDLKKYTEFGSPGVNRFIPADLSLESSCKKGKKDDDDFDIPFLSFVTGSKQEYLETTYIQKSNFTSLINDMIAERWDNKKQQENHYLEKECIIEELKKDSETEQPTKFSKTQFSEGWLFTDRTSMKPYLYFLAHLQQPDLLYSNPKEKLASQLLSFLLKKKLSESLSDAYKVGYGIRFGITDNGISLYAGGWSSETHKVLKVLIDSLKEIRFTQKEYDQIRASIMKFLDNDLSSGALSQTKSYLFKSLKMSYYTSSELRAQLGEITLGDVYKIKSKLFKNVFVKAYMTGNVRSDTAKMKFDQVLNSINHYSSKSNSVMNQDPIRKDIVKLSSDEGLVLREWNKNPSDLNNGIINYYQAGVSTSLERILLSLALKTVSKRAYIFLRTKHQLGYIVFASQSTFNSVSGMLVGVQGSAKSPYEMDALIEEFLGIYEKQLEDMDEKVIEATKIRMLRAMYAKPFSAFSKLVYFWTPIKSGNYEFEDTGSVVSDLTLLSKKRVLSFFKRVFKRDQKKLSVQVFSRVNNEKIPEELLDKSKALSGKPEVLVGGVDEIRNREKYSEY